MATQIVIANNDYIKVDDGFHIDWADKGTVMPSLPDTIHYVIWNNVIGQNEIQTKDPATEKMTGNTDLNVASDAVGSTTINDLLTWSETRKGQIETATAAYIAAADDDIANETNNTNGKTWVDYDPHYS